MTHQENKRIGKYLVERLKLPQVKPPKPFRPGSSLAQTTRVVRQERAGAAPQKPKRRKPTYLDPDVSMEGIELKMNKYVQALTEVHGRRVKPTRPSSGGGRQAHQETGNEPARPAGTGPGTEGGTETHYPAETKKQRADRKRRIANPRRKMRDWTEYQRIGSVLAERRGPPGPDSERYDPDYGEHPGEARQRETGKGSGGVPGKAFWDEARLERRRKKAAARKKKAAAK